MELQVSFYSHFGIVHEGESNIGILNNYVFYKTTTENIIENEEGEEEIEYIVKNYLVEYLGTNEATSIILPQNYGGENYEIFCGAFYGFGNIKSIDLPSGVVGVGEIAFGNCVSLEKVTMGNGVTNISKTAFLGCPYEMTFIYGGTMNEWNLIPNINEHFWEHQGRIVHCVDGDITGITEMPNTGDQEENTGENIESNTDENTQINDGSENEKTE